LHDDGTVAADRMRADTRAALANLLTNPETARSLGLDGKTATATLPPMLGTALVNVLADLDLLIVARLTGAPPSTVKAVAWTPNERAALEGPAMAVLQKYGGAVLTKWADEVSLLTAYASITMMKVAAVRETMAHASADARPRVVPISPAEQTADPPEGAS
jgi:hypothetical protein